MKHLTILALALALAIAGCGCGTSSNRIQSAQQEKMMMEATAQIGMPAIKNFRERKILKDIMELRDQADLVTYTYVWSEMRGKFTYLGQTVGYGIPAATQYTAAEGYMSSPTGGMEMLPQADPNGLFSPESAEGTWVLMKDPNGGDVKPLYVEPRILVSPFKLSGSTVAD